MSAAGGRAVLEVRELRKRYRRGLPGRRRSVEVLRGATLEVRAGELVGLVGENGSGKSTLLQLVASVLDRDGGAVERAGRLRYCPQRPAT